MCNNRRYFLAQASGRATKI